MKRQRWIALAMLCLLLAGTTVASADSDRDRGDRRKDRGSKSERYREEQPRKQRSVRRSDSRDGRWSGRHDGRWSDRRVAEVRRQPTHVVVERPRPIRLNEHVVSRTATPATWRKSELRGRARYAAWDGHRARHWRSEHRTWSARGGYHGYWIPDHRYRVVFGPRHWFRIDRCPLVIVGGYPRFYHGGYWITFIDPWPEYWADDWFARDDCYIVYDDDGYYLTNVRHPSVRIAISFTLG